MSGAGYALNGRLARGSPGLDREPGQVADVVAKRVGLRAAVF